MTQESKIITTIYEGELVSCWKDEECLYINFPWCCVNFPLEDSKEIIEELHELIAALTIDKTIDIENFRNPSFIDSKPQSIDPKNWQDEISDIVNKSDRDRECGNCKECEEKSQLLVQRGIEEGTKINPSEKSQEFLNSLFLTFAANEKILDALILAFKTGMIFQKYRNDFEGVKNDL